MSEDTKSEVSRVLSAAREHRDAMTILSLSAVVLILAEYLLIPLRFAKLFPEFLRRWAPSVSYGNVELARAAGESGPWWGPLAPFLWWIGGLLLLWGALPLWSGRRLGFAATDLGLRWGRLSDKVRVYALLFAPVAIGVLWASGRESFQRTYPMLRPEQAGDWTWTLLLTFWALYALQFLCVEFFFRGYLLFGLESHFGAAAIGVSVIPYCMIHFHKPLPEVFGALVAGLVLGWLALQTRSIWGGVFLHIAVALSMDIAALSRGSTGFPTVWWP